MELLTGIIESIIWMYWTMVDSFSNIGNAYDWVANATWMTELSGNLQNLCMTKLMPAFSGVGIAIAVTYFLISIISLVTEDRLTPEFLAKFFAKLAISVAVIMWSDTILKAIIEFGDAMGRMFSNWTTADFLNTSTTLNTEFDLFANAFIDEVCADYGFTCTGTFSKHNLVWKETSNAIGIIGAIGAALTLLLNSVLLTLLSYLVLPIVSAIIYFIEISRLIELYIRGSLLPIAAGVMADDGWRGTGGRYIKKILALATQKIVLSLTCTMTSAMAVNYLLSQLKTAAGDGAVAFIAASFSMMITAIVICFAGIAFMFKSLQVVNDLWGAS